MSDKEIEAHLYVNDDLESEAERAQEILDELGINYSTFHTDEDGDNIPALHINGLSYKGLNEIENFQENGRN